MMAVKEQNRSQKAECHNFDTEINLGFSYGYGEGRDQHNALDALYLAVTQKKINWILDIDIEGFFDSVSHEWMLKFLKHRIADKRILRLIQEWLKTGDMVKGVKYST